MLLLQIEKSMQQLAEIEAANKSVNTEATYAVAEKRKGHSAKEQGRETTKHHSCRLSDPSTVARIEDYDDSFAPGNFDNLRRVAQLLAQQADGPAQQPPTSMPANS